MYTYLGLICYLDYLGEPLFKSVIQEKDILFFGSFKCFFSPVIQVGIWKQIDFGRYSVKYWSHEIQK